MIEPTDLENRLASAHRARAAVVETFTTARIIAALARAAGAWLQDDGPLRRRAIEVLERATGQAAGMLAMGLDFIFSAVNEISLRELVVCDVGPSTHLDPSPDDRVKASSQRRLGPPAIYYGLAGNVPGQGIPAIVVALLARSVTIIRDSERQPFLTSAFRETIARYEPELAEMIVPLGWSSRSFGEEEKRREQLVIAAASRVHLFGSASTLNSLVARYAATSRVPITAHGPALSLGLVPAGTDLASAAQRFALDVTMYEGRGCLTPHVIVCEGESFSAAVFAELLASALAARAAEWPRARGSLAEEAERRRYLGDAELAALANPQDRAFVGPQAAWCVHLSANAAPSLGPGLRCVRVRASKSRRETLAALSGVSLPLAAVGVATENDADPVVTGLAKDLMACGATLVCNAGRMQAPPIGWQQDGRRRLHDLLEGNT